MTNTAEGFMDSWSAIFYEDGFNDYFTGLDIDENPYLGDDARWGWHRGWLAAEAALLIGDLS